MTKAAYLKVYAPEVEESNDPVPGFVRTYGLLSEEEGDTNWTVEWDGKSLVCPRNLRLRVLESTVAFANAFRGLGAGLIPEDAARAADHELRAYHRAHPEHRSHRTSASTRALPDLLPSARRDARHRYREPASATRHTVTH